MYRFFLFGSVCLLQTSCHSHTGGSSPVGQWLVILLPFPIMQDKTLSRGPAPCASFKTDGWSAAHTHILREEEGPYVFSPTLSIFSLLQTHSFIACFCVSEESPLWPLKETFPAAWAFWALSSASLAALSPPSKDPMSHLVLFLW